MAKGVAVGVGEGAFGGGAYMGKDKVRGCLGSDAGQVDTIPSWDCAGEYARGRPEVGWCVVADTEAVTVMRATGVLRRD